MHKCMLMINVLQIFKHIVLTHYLSMKKLGAEMGQCFATVHSVWNAIDLLNPPFLSNAFIHLCKM